MTAGFIPILSGDVAPQNVSFLISDDNGVSFTWIGWQLMNPVGQLVTADRLVPGYAQVWKFAAVVGVVGGNPAAKVTAANLSNQYPGVIVSGGFNVLGLGKPCGGVPACPIVPTSYTNAILFNSIFGDSVPTAQTLTIASTPSATVYSILQRPSWLNVSNASGNTPLAVQLSVNPTGLAPGVYSTTIQFSTSTTFSADSGIIVPITLAVTPDDRPVITSVVNAASFKQIIGPGTWISVMGSNLAKTVMQQPTLPLPVMLNGVSVELRGVGGVYNMLMHYVSPTQINAFVPHELPVSFFNASCVVAVTVPTGATSMTTNCQGLAPALFSYGTQQYASATHIDGAIVGVIAGTRPAQSGEIITLWGTGFGQTAPPVSNVNGVFAPQVLANQAVVYVGGQSVQLLWAGMVGTGLYQFNIQLPDNVSIGDNPVSIKIGGVETERVVLPIR